MDIKASEKMVSRAAKELVEGEIVFVGIGLPNIACNLARLNHAPNLFMIYESGAVGTLPERLPVSIGDPALVTDSLSICGVPDIFQNYLQKGKIDVGFLSGAQIDPYGNINSTFIGDDYHNPKVRLPGSGGACEIATHSKKIYIIMRMNNRAFVEKCDFITTPGHVYEGKSRKELGCPGAGPQAIITDKCVLRFNDEGRMYISEIFPGVTIEEIQENCGFTIEAAESLKEIALPSEKELKLLRETLDPQGLYI